MIRIYPTYEPHVYDSEFDMSLIGESDSRIFGEIRSALVTQSVENFYRVNDAIDRMSSKGAVMEILPYVINALKSWSPQNRANKRFDTWRFEHGEELQNPPSFSELLQLSYFPEQHDECRWGFHDAWEQGALQQALFLRARDFRTFLDTKFVASHVNGLLHKHDMSLVYRAKINQDDELFFDESNASFITCGICAEREIPKNQACSRCLGEGYVPISLWQHRGGIQVENMILKEHLKHAHVRGSHLVKSEVNFSMSSMAYTFDAVITTHCRSNVPRHVDSTKIDVRGSVAAPLVRQVVGNVEAWEFESLLSSEYLPHPSQGTIDAITTQPWNMTQGVV